MDANEFFNLRIKRAKEFGFPEPVYINTERLTPKTRVVYLVEIQAIHIPDRKRGGTHHYALKFSKFKKIKEEPYWVEEEITTEKGFIIRDRVSIEKLAAYLRANAALLNINVTSQDFKEGYFVSDKITLDFVKFALQREKGQREEIYKVFKEHYPDLDKKILTYKLVQSRKKALEVFKRELENLGKNERNFWQKFLEENRWMFGLSYIIPLDRTDIDLWDEADYLFESEDGFVDIVEIKNPHLPFWQRANTGEYKRYRGFLQPSEELKGSVTQAINYIFQLEKKFNDIDWQRHNKCEAPVKPTCTIIFGRSCRWQVEEKESYRLLNDSLHGVKIITYDYLYDRASRLLNVLERET